MLDGDQEMVGKDAEEDVRIDASFKMMEDGALGQGALHRTEGGLGAGQRHVDAPGLVGGQVGAVGLQQVGAVQFAGAGVARKVLKSTSEFASSHRKAAQAATFWFSFSGSMRSSTSSAVW